LAYLTAETRRTQRVKEKLLPLCALCGV